MAHLVLQAAVLALGVLPHDEDVDVAVPRLHPGKALAVDHVGVQVQAGPAPPRHTQVRPRPSATPLPPPPIPQTPMVPSSPHTVPWFPHPGGSIAPSSPPSVPSSLQHSQFHPQRSQFSPCHSASHLMRLLRDLWLGGRLWLVSMFPGEGTVSGVRVSPSCQGQGWGFPSPTLTLEGDAIAADGHDGVVHVVLGRLSADPHLLEVHRNAGVPGGAGSGTDVWVPRTAWTHGSSWGSGGGAGRGGGHPPEDLLDMQHQFGADAVAGDQRHGMAAPVLGGGRLWGQQGVRGAGRAGPMSPSSLHPLPTSPIPCLGNSGAHHADPTHAPPTPPMLSGSPPPHPQSGHTHDAGLLRGRAAMARGRNGGS